MAISILLIDLCDIYENELNKKYETKLKYTSGSEEVIFSGCKIKTNSK